MVGREVRFDGYSVIGNVLKTFYKAYVIGDMGDKLEVSCFTRELLVV